MDPLHNPYTPNAGAEPEVMVGRSDFYDRFRLLLARLERGRTEQSMIITGLRGVGKTVLLGQFRTIAQENKWVVVDLEASKHEDTQFRRTLASHLRTALFALSPKARWNNTLHRAANVLSSFSFTVDSSGSVNAGFDLEAAGPGAAGDLALDLTDALVAVGEAARDQHRGVVLLIDEIQFLSRGQLEALIQAIHKTVQRKLPITLVGAGLPQIAELAGDAKSYAERLFTFLPLGNLNDGDTRQALDGPAQLEGVAYEPQALDRAVTITGGYPYFIQELGHAVWPIAAGNTITLNDINDAEPLYEAKLDSSFFRVRLDRTTSKQREYLRAMARLGPHPQKAADVAAVLNRTSPQVAPIRAELINLGLLYTPQHGYAAFTVPHFDAFLMRTLTET